MNLAFLKKQRAAAAEAAQKIFTTAETENRALTAEELAAFTAKEAEVKSLDEQIAAGERALKLGAQATGAVPPAPHTPASVHNREEDRPFSNLGEMLLCVRAAATTPSAIDPRLQVRAATGANEGVGSEGGFLVGTDVSGQLIQEMHDMAVLAPLCQEIPISANSNAVTINGVDETTRVDGSRWGGVQAYWADEAGSTTATKPKFRRIELKLKKLFAVYYATDEVLQDAAALATVAQRAFAEEMAFKVDDAIVRGKGAGTPLGILEAAAKVSVAKETGQVADTFLYENAVKMYSRMTPRSLPNAVWYINSEVYPQLMTMKLAVGTGGAPVFIPGGSAANAPYGTLLGRPIRPIEFCAALGDQGDVIFADFGQYLLATKGAVQQASSIHVQFLVGEQVFRFTYRCDGQPARSAPLTPYKGSATLSPFVVLDARA